MSGKFVVESSETGRIEIDYGALSVREIGRRIQGYEKKYGMGYTAFSRRFSCDSASPDEMTDIMDWEYLLEERKGRTRKARGKRDLTYQKG